MYLHVEDAGLSRGPVEAEPEDAGLPGVARVAEASEAEEEEPVCGGRVRRQLPLQPVQALQLAVVKVGGRRGRDDGDGDDEEEEEEGGKAGLHLQGRGNGTTLARVCVCVCAYLGRFILSTPPSRCRSQTLVCD